MKNLVRPVICLAVAGIWPAVEIRGQDVIRYWDSKTQKEASITCKIQEENPGHIAYTVGVSTAAKEIAALDIIDITYNLPGSVIIAFRTAQVHEQKTLDVTVKEEERKKAAADAVKSYSAMLDNLAGDKYRLVLRHMEYKIARLKARAADDDHGELEGAIAGLADFVRKYPDSWQVTRAAKTLARLQILKGDIAAAQQTYQALAAVSNVPPEVKAECQLLTAQALIEGKLFSEAEGKLRAQLRAVPPADPQALRIQMLLSLCRGAAGKLSEAVKELESLRDRVDRPELKAAACNALGDCYRLSGKPRDAIWPYLWVDVIYHQDKQEHQRAMGHLAQLFDELGDKPRARQYRDRLRREAR